MKKLVAVLALISFNVHAAPDCRELPSCESLGFICSAEECGDLKALSCPFDLSKKTCFPKDKDCEVGDVLYNDLKCHDASCGKKPIGVVYDVEQRLAVPLARISGHQWSSTLADIPDLENCTTTTAKTTCGTDGKANTLALIKYGQENNVSFLAAEYCNNLVINGEPAGTWWMPSVKELYTIGQNYITIKNVFLGHNLEFYSGMSYTPTSTELNAEHYILVEVKTGSVFGGNYYSDKSKDFSTLCVTRY